VSVCAYAMPVEPRTHSRTVRIVLYLVSGFRSAALFRGVRRDARSARVQLLCTPAQVPGATYVGLDYAGGLGARRRRPPGGHGVGQLASLIAARLCCLSLFVN
jgi:hypothetical protein